MKIPKWLIATILNILIATVIYLTTDEKTNFTTITSLLALIFLCLTIIPGNIVKFVGSEKLRGYLGVLISLRRDFGITFGLTILAHAIFAIFKYYNFDLTKILRPETLSGDIALITILFMLITSIVKLQKRFPIWKQLHAVIWFALPIILIHGILASTLFKNEVGIVNILTLILILLGIVKTFLNTYIKDRVIDLILIIIGILISAVFYYWKVIYF